MSQTPTQPQNYRVPPHSLEAELSLLGSLMLGHADAIDRARALVIAADFYRPTHGEIFNAMLALADRSEPIDIVTVKDELGKRGTIDNIGGVGYLMQLGDIAFTTANLESYAKIVSEKASRRRLIEECSALATAAYGPEDDSPNLLEEAERRILAIRDAADRGRNAEQYSASLNDVLSQTMDQIDEQHHNRGQLVGLSTGFTLLDLQLTGLHRGDLILIAGRPSMGKSAIASQMFVDICRNDGSAIFFSLEMSRRQIGQRVVCAEARVNAQHVRTGYVADDEWRRLQSGVERLWNRTGLIDDNGSASLGYLRSVCRRRKAKHGLDAVFVDYIQLLDSNTAGQGEGNRRGGGGSENRNLELGAISKGLKGIAREFDVPVVALAQLSRSVERREDKRPLLSDLRDSGSLEADADVILFPYRAAYYANSKAISAADPSEMETAEIIVGKQRMGPRGSVPIGFTPAFARFENLAAEPEGIF